MRPSPEQLACIAAVCIALLGALGWWATGTIYSSAKAFDLINALRSPALYLGSSMATTSGTILALMLTVVGFVHRSERDFSRRVYLRIRTIAVVSTLSLIGSVLLLLMLTLPVGQFEKLPHRWFPILYDTIYALVVFLSALLVGTVTMLLSTLIDLIAEITPMRKSDD